MKKYDYDFYHLESYDELVAAVEGYWSYCGIDDRGSCVEFYKNSFNYPQYFILGLNYMDDGEISYVNIRTISVNVIDKIKQGK